MDKDQWLLNMTQVLMRDLPGNTYTSAATLASDWLSTNGGWEPDDIGEPDGEGEPTNGDTYQEAAAAVVTDAVSSTRLLRATFPVDVSVVLTGTFGSGVSNATAIADVTASLLTRLQSTFAGAQIGFGGEAGDVGTASGITSVSGLTIVSDRTAAQANIVSGTPGVMEAATKAARVQYGLPNSWMCSTIYVKDNSSPAMCIIKKYTDTGYATLDAAATHMYVVPVDSVTGLHQGVTKVEI